MKKLLWVLVTAVAVLTCAFGFSGCGLFAPSENQENAKNKNPDAGLYKLNRIVAGDKTYNLGDEFGGQVLTEDLSRIYIDDAITQIAGNNGQYYCAYAVYSKDGDNYVVTDKSMTGYEFTSTITISDGVLALTGKDISYSSTGGVVYGEEYTMYYTKDETTKPYVGTYALESIEYNGKIYSLGEKIIDGEFEITLNKDDVTVIIDKDCTFTVIRKNMFGSDGKTVIDILGYDDATFNPQALCFDSDDSDLLILRNGSAKYRLRKTDYELKKFDSQAGTYKFFSAEENGMTYNIGDLGGYYTEDSLVIDLFPSGIFNWTWREGAMAGKCFEDIMYYRPNVYDIEITGDTMVITCEGEGSCTLKKVKKAQ